MCSQAMYMCIILLLIYRQCDIGYMCSKGRLLDVCLKGKLSSSLFYKKWPTAFGKWGGNTYIYMYEVNITVIITSYMCLTVTAGRLLFV